MSDISLIMVTYNSAGVVETSLAAALADASVTACYVVDNASSDNTREIIQHQFPQAKIIYNHENKGFGAANNQALECVTTEFALLLNPDAVPEPGAIKALLETAGRYPQAAIIAPLIRSPNGEYETSFKRNVFTREQYRAIWQVPEGDISAEYVSGAVCLVRMEHIRKVGFFDPAIFFYYEDDDLCLRVRNAGYDIVVTPSALVTHNRGHSSAPNATLDAWKQQQLIISRVYLERKYHGDATAQKLAGTIRRNAWLKMLLYKFLFCKRKYHKHQARYRAASY